MSKTKKLAFLVAALSSIAVGTSISFLVSAKQKPEQKLDKEMILETLEETKAFLSNHEDESDYQELKNLYDQTQKDIDKYNQEQLDEQNEKLQSLLEQSKQNAELKRQQLQKELDSLYQKGSKLADDVKKWLNDTDTRLIDDEAKKLSDELESFKNNLTKNYQDKNANAIKKENDEFATKKQNLKQLLDQKQREQLQQNLNNVKSQSDELIKDIEDWLSSEDTSKIKDEVDKFKANFDEYKKIVQKDYDNQDYNSLSNKTNDLKQKFKDIKNLLNLKRQQDLDKSNQDALNKANELLKNIKQSDLENKENLANELENKIKQNNKDFASSDFPTKQQLTKDLLKAVQDTELAFRQNQYKKSVDDANNLKKNLQNSDNFYQDLIKKVDDALKNNKPQDTTKPNDFENAVKNLNKAIEDIKKQQQDRDSNEKVTFNANLSSAKQMLTRLQSIEESYRTSEITQSINTLANLINKYQNSTTNDAASLRQANSQLKAAINTAEINWNNLTQEANNQQTNQANKLRSFISSFDTQAKQTISNLDTQIANTTYTQNTKINVLFNNVKLYKNLYNKATLYKTLWQDALQPTNDWLEANKDKNTNYINDLKSKLQTWKQNAILYLGYKTDATALYSQLKIEILDNLNNVKQKAKADEQIASLKPTLNQLNGNIATLVKLNAAEDEVKPQLDNAKTNVESTLSSLSKIVNGQITLSDQKFNELTQTSAELVTQTSQLSAKTSAFVDLVNLKSFIALENTKPKTNQLLNSTITAYNSWFGHNAALKSVAEYRLSQTQFKNALDFGNKLNTALTTIDDTKEFISEYESNFYGDEYPSYYQNLKSTYSQVNTFIENVSQVDITKNDKLRTDNQNLEINLLASKIYDKAYSQSNRPMTNTEQSVYKEGMNKFASKVSKMNFLNCWNFMGNNLTLGI
ncbi:MULTISPECIES: hypothetical protein [unclassified Mycoplasma]